MWLRGFIQLLPVPVGETLITRNKAAYIILCFPFLLFSTQIIVSFYRLDETEQYIPFPHHSCLHLYICNIYM